MKKIPALISLLALFVSISQGVCQNPLVFTSVNATPEKSIILNWQSNTNEYYEIDYADTLVDTNTGTTTWNYLYDDFPSQGTNTFWQDAGNFNATPNVPHPATTLTRFYRVSLEGTNTMTYDNLSVSINNLTNGSVVSGGVTVTVTASSSQLISTILLYLDGKEMPRSLDGSNFVFNSCETWNGSHTLFAVAKSQSGMEGFRLDAPITYDRAVSPMINISIQNLITDYAFSLNFFQPSLGQTQLVTANFTANCNWTLQILDSNSNAVRTVSGSGKSMGFLWDGTGDGGTNIPDAVYTYELTAGTNALPMVLGGSTSAVSNTKTWWALAPDSENPIPLAILPIGFDTNGMTIFKASQAQIDDLVGDTNSADVSTSGSYFHPNNSGGAGSTQSTSHSGNKNALGTIGVCYQRFQTPGLYGHYPASGYPPPLAFVSIDGQTGSTASFGFPVINQSKITADDFCNTMKGGGYLPSFEYADAQVKINDLKKTSEGGNSIFNNVNFGLLCAHSSYGTTAESDGVKYTYIWVENLPNTQVSYLRLSDFDFGGTQPTGLRWMTILSCSALNQTCYNSMNSHSKLPINSNLHTLLAGSTTVYFAPDIGLNYARNLLFNETIINAWKDAGTFTYTYQHGTNMTGATVKFAHAGWSTCTSDEIQSYSPPGGSITYGQDQVFP